ncbi:hypothetical protein [Bradyrhizobium glycinis]|uniref:hypothetical protein n=1 Tax=Bradyrhizobium glycinis TaxID=2751812 RepID=UPI001FE25D69|nr:hypothetical protein [Bradyrhizobium glycinis]
MYSPRSRWRRSARYQNPVAMGGDDDDAVCQSRGYAQGSPEYVACRKDRDVQRNAATARAEQAERATASREIAPYCASLADIWSSCLIRHRRA